MTKWLTVLAAAGVVGTAAAQAPPAASGSPSGVTFPTPPVPVVPQGAFMPNYYDRARQPLSPYLNLFRGQIPSVDYYFGVRPGIQAGNVTGSGFGVPTGVPQSRPGYLPLGQATAEVGVEVPLAGLPLPGNQLAPTGRPATFGAGPGRVAPGTGAGRPGFTSPLPRRTSAGTPPVRR